MRRTRSDLARGGLPPLSTWLSWSTTVHAASSSFGTVMA
jgi:hypothetical protein